MDMQTWKHKIYKKTHVCVNGLETPADDREWEASDGTVYAFVLVPIQIGQRVGKWLELGLARYLVNVYFNLNTI